MSDVVSHSYKPSVEHKQISVPTGVGISQAPDGTRTVTQSGFVDQCITCGRPWPCLPAKIQEAESRIAELTHQRDGALAMLDQYREAFKAVRDDLVCLGEAYCREYCRGDNACVPEYTAPVDAILATNDPLADRAREIGAAVAGLAECVGYLWKPGPCEHEGEQCDGCRAQRMALLWDALAAYRRATGMQGGGEEG